MKYRRILFLDFDGVLNSLEYARRRGPRPKGDDLTAAAHLLDPVAVALVNEIVKRGRAKIVISSSWREMTSVERLRQLLRCRGFVGTVVGKTPSLLTAPRVPQDAGQIPLPDGAERMFRERGDEIAAWLSEHGPVESFVILDDDNDMGALQHRLVRTTFNHGLRPAHVVRALALLRHGSSTTAPRIGLRDLPSVLREKIAARIGGCWLWCAALTPDGYGKVRWDGKLELAARVIYQLVHDVELGDDVLRHQCLDNACVNPAHMFLTTAVANTLAGEGPTATNTLKIHCEHGHPLLGDNVFLEERPDGGTSRKCKTCMKLRHRDRRDAQSAARTDSTEARPSGDVLLRLAAEFPATKLALRFGVSDTTIRNWLRAARAANDQAALDDRSASGKLER